MKFDIDSYKKELGGEFVYHTCSDGTCFYKGSEQIRRDIDKLAAEINRNVEEVRVSKEILENPKES